MSTDGGSGHGSDEPDPPDPPGDQETGTTSPAVSLSDLVRLSSMFEFKHMQTAEDQASPAWFVDHFQLFISALPNQVFVRDHC